MSKHAVNAVIAAANSNTLIRDLLKDADYNMIHHIADGILNVTPEEIHEIMSNFGNEVDTSTPTVGMAEERNTPGPGLTG